jgi:polygalacturonase
VTSTRLALAAIAALALCPGTAAATTFTAACSGTTGDVASLKAAITAANTSEGNDTVRLGAGRRYIRGALTTPGMAPTGFRRSPPT